MRIELQEPYKSIASLDTVELPNLAILIGRNGAGKSQLLEALKAGNATILGIRVDDIELRDMSSFRPPNANTVGPSVNNFAQATADAYLLSPDDGQSLKVKAAAIFERIAIDVERDSGAQGLIEFEQNVRDELRRLPDFEVFGPSQSTHTNYTGEYKKSLHQELLAPIDPNNQSRSGRQRNEPRHQYNGNQATLLSMAMKLTGKLPHELTRDDIIRASFYEGNIIANSISEVFASYKIERFNWAHSRVEWEPMTLDEAYAEYDSTYPPPWNSLRRILSAMQDATGGDGLFNFDFSDPEKYQLTLSSLERFTFKAEMTNKSNGAQYDLASLSSGEKVLMALCLASFNQYLGRRRPKLLLLDEIDSVLHPSMVSALVVMLKDLFVSQGTKVLMTSHSPMTVAALDEDDIFRVANASGDVQVSPVTKSQAIRELSEGLAIVDVGLRIAAYNEAKVTILTEGNNVNHLKAWAKLYFPEDVRVFEGIEDHSGKNQLVLYGRLLAEMNLNTHFVVVWDCDADKSANELRASLPSGSQVTAFAFPKRSDNQIATRGIENNYDAKILEPYSTTTRDSEEAVIGQGFDGRRKTEFADHVLQCGTQDYFKNYQELYEIVEGLISQSV